MKHARLFAAGVFLLLSSFSVLAQPRVLESGQWLEDLDQLAGAIIAKHPQPFSRVERSVFVEHLEQLRQDIARLEDKEIIVRLAAIVALVKDGHTRLTIPRQHPEIGLEFGHSGSPAPNHEALEFTQLPVAFEQFEDGIFVVAASGQWRHLIGARLTGIDGMPAGEAMRRARSLAFAENLQLEKLMGADRLSLPEAMSALDVVKDSGAVHLALAGPDGGDTEVIVRPLPAGAVDWVGMNEAVARALRNRHPGRVFWSEYLAQGPIVYARIDEIADAETSLAHFVTGIVRQAEENDARLIIDLRSNFGGSGSLNRTLELALIQSEALNQYGRTFVLIGRRTFSAAQLLANSLEAYTRVLFVGEPSGARPDHFGDARTTRLAHSGLTLRVSSLHWSSPRAHDARESLSPDLPAPWTSAQFFAGQDPALEVARDYRFDFTALLRSAFERGDEYLVGRYLADQRWSPDTFSEDFSATLLEVGRQLQARGQHNQAGLAYRYGLFFFPGDAELKEALQSLPSGSE